MLDGAQRRVLGCLIEKQKTTPEYYPLTLNALLAACNQRTNREPVVDYDAATVLAALDALREHGLARAVQRPGQRAAKYRHAADEVLQVDSEQLSLLSVLLLRGPQTVGELRSRTDRYVEFPSLAAVNDVLVGLATRDEPLVERLDRRPGEKEPRWQHLLGETVTAGPPAADGEPGEEEAPLGLQAQIDDLRRDLDALTARVETLIRTLGG